MAAPDTLEVRALERRANAAPLVLCMMFHSNEATAGASPYFDSDEGVSGFLARMADFFEWLHSAAKVRALGLSDIVVA